MRYHYQRTFEQQVLSVTVVFSVSSRQLAAGALVFWKLLYIETRCRFSRFPFSVGELVMSIQGLSV